MSDKHDEAHEHETDESFESRILTAAENREREIQVKAIEALLGEKNLVSNEMLDTVLDAYENDIGPLNGCRVVARAWTDLAYKARLLEDGTKAVAELGFGGLQGEHLIVVENTPETHNVIVCALCSCYPWPVLGLPPFWYKSQSYRSRVIGKPREVLQEFGLELDESVSIQVWNSNFKTRYMVLPERPAGTEHMTEDELVAIITRDSMIGVAQIECEKKQTPGSEQRIAQRHVSDMQGSIALPRKSGELQFQDPWEGEAFAMAVALCEQRHYDWSEFQAGLIDEIAVADQQASEVRPTYYESWITAFEKLLDNKNILAQTSINRRVRQIKRGISMRRTRLPFGIAPWHDDEDEKERLSGIWREYIGRWRFQCLRYSSRAVAACLKSTTRRSVGVRVGGIRIAFLRLSISGLEIRWRTLGRGRAILRSN